MKIVVTGATGVLGREAVAALAKAGHQVTGVTRRESGIPVITGRGGHGVVADVFNRDSLAEVFEGHDAIVNVLTHIPLSTDALKPGAWRTDDRLHSEASAAIAGAARDAGVGRLVQESIAFMYPDMGSDWINEEVQIAPTSAQRPRVAETRHAIEFAGPDRVSVVLRLGLLYGGDKQSTLNLELTRAGKRVLLGTPQQYISLLHVSDAGRAIVSSLLAPTGIYNVAAEPITRERYAADLGREAGSAGPAQFFPDLVQLVSGHRTEGLRRSHRINSAKFQATTGWRPEIGTGTKGWSRL
ncbi:NAD(P)-dependent oxidoreductase [Micrococcales bacterium 31B]|nr:NAD(P)-dependent oxidoreductase [Micrococcales bacterium 31B]